MLHWPHSLRPVAQGPLSPDRSACVETGGLGFVPLHDPWMRVGGPGAGGTTSHKAAPWSQEELGERERVAGRRPGTQGSELWSRRAI